MATNNEIIESLAVAADFNLTTAKVSLRDIPLPPLAEDQVTPPDGDAINSPVNDVLQSNHASLSPEETRDLVVLPAKLNDSFDLAVGFEKLGALRDINPDEIIVRISEFYGEPAHVLASGVPTVMIDASGVRYRTRLDLTGEALAALVANYQKSKTSFVDALCEIEVVVSVDDVAAAIAKDGAAYTMSHNQSQVENINIDLPDQANSSTVIYDVIAQVNLPASSAGADVASLATTISVTRDAGGVFTATSVTGASSDLSGIAYLPVYGGAQHADYTHDLSVTVSTNGSTGVTIQATVATQNYSNAKRISYTHSNTGDGWDTSGNFVLVVGDAVIMDDDVTTYASFAPANGSSHTAMTTDIETKMKAQTTDDAYSVKSYIKSSNAFDLVIVPSVLTNNITELDVHSFTQGDGAALGFTMVPHTGGSYAGSFVSVLFTEPSAGSPPADVRRTSQNMILRFVQELG